MLAAVNRPHDKPFVISEHSSVDKYAFAILIFMLLFGIKLFGVIDIAQLTLVAILALYYQRSLGHIFMTEIYTFSLLVLMLVLTHTILTSILFHTFDYYAVMRLMRALATSFLLAILIPLLKVRKTQGLAIIVFCIFIHAICIITQMANPELKELMAILVGHDKQTVFLRAFGLVSAYDTAGALLLIGMVISSYFVFKLRRTYYIYIIVVFYIAGLATGRVFMVVGTLYFVLVLFKFLFKKNRKYLAKLIILLIGGVFVFYFMKYIQPILSVSLYLVDKEAVSNDIQISRGGYYIGTLSILQSYLMLPQEGMQLLFGSGELIKVDIGYIKILHSVGLIGMLLMTFYYILFAILSYTKNREDTKLLFMPILFIFFLYNFKMLTFFTRSYHETIIVILILLCLNRERENVKIGVGSKFK